MKEESQKPDLAALREVLPPFVLRTFPNLRQLTGYSGRSLANMDCLGLTKGITRIKLGNGVAYERESFIRWLESRAKVLS